MQLVLEFSVEETHIWNDPDSGKLFCDLAEEVSSKYPTVRSILGKDNEDEPLYNLEWHAPHQKQGVNDRMESYCLDCGKILGR